MIKMNILVFTFYAFCFATPNITLAKDFSLGYSLTSANGYKMTGYNVVISPIDSFPVSVSGTFSHNESRYKQKYASLMLGTSLTNGLEFTPFIGVAATSNVSYKQRHELYGPAAGFTLAHKFLENMILYTGCEFAYVYSDSVRTCSVGVGISM
ncbi:hypothetical protein [Enterobacter asburiae]|uniref:hypothetical protein n=1 Tax=Enterobacter asburiae TaxID=61645 RepID=UPI002A835007|nr:hypothetical protein [Enterobacter asburiae]